MIRLAACSSIPLFAVLAGCGGSTTPQSCGPPAPTAAPYVALVYPAPGATAVPARIGAIIFAGGDNLVTPASLSVTSSGLRVAIGTFTAAPSPLPTPNAIPTGNFGSSFFEATIPVLSPATVYAVSYSYAIERSGPPSCNEREVVPLGSFTTQ